MRPLVPALALFVLVAGCRKPAPPIEVIRQAPATLERPDVVFKPVNQRVHVEPCPNCIWDAEKQVSTMRYQPGGPQPFNDGDNCVICSNEGRLFGTIGWEDGDYDAPGFAATKKKEPTAVDRGMCERGAQIAAVRNAVRLAGQIRVDEATLLETRSGVIELEAFVQGATVKETKWWPGPGEPWAQKQVRVPMYGVSGLYARTFTVESGTYQRKLAAFAPRGTVAMTEAVTHIVLDARTADPDPAFFPRVLTTDGKIVYDLASADPGVVKSSGLVQYYTSDEALEQGWLDERRDGRYAALPGPVQVAALGGRPERWLLAQRREREGGRWRPVVIQGEGKGKKCDILVSEKDAERMAAADKNGGAMKNAQVIVVVGSRVAGKRGERPREIHLARLDAAR